MDTVIKKIWIESHASSPSKTNHELRIEWENGQYMAVELRNLAPGSIVTGLDEMAGLINHEELCSLLENR